MFKFLNRLFSTPPNPTTPKQPAPRSSQHTKHTLALGQEQQHQITYQINRRPPHHTSQRIYISIRHSIVSVTTPSWISQAQIEAFLREKSAWITQHLEHQKQHQTTIEDSLFTPDAIIDYLGQAYTLRQVPLKQKAPIIEEHTLHIPFEGSHQSTNEADYFHQATIKVLQHQALNHFKQRVHFFVQHIQKHHLSAAPLLSENPRVSLTKAKGRWGSCSTTGTIRLHWRLIHLSPNLIDYVVAHEVAHLAYMNHSADFWQLVERLIPDYKNRQKQLRQFAVLLSL